MTMADQPSIPDPAETAKDDEADQRRDERRDAGWLVRLKAALGLGPDVSIRQSLETALEHPGPMTAVFSPEERLMLLNILGFRQLRIEDVMVPRADIIAVDETTELGDLLRIFEKAGHSRIPTYRDTLDDPSGMVHIKDLMGFVTRQGRHGRVAQRASTPPAPPDAAAPPRVAPASLDLGKVDLGKTLSSTKLVRPVLFVPPSMPAVDLLVQMQATRIHMALVVDEYGGTEGLVSIEDLVEEIVGDIEDEHDPAEDAQIVASEDGSYIADARAMIEDFRELIGKDLGLSEVEEDVDTLGGLVFSLLGRIPVRGEIVTYPGGLEFEVLDADPRRVKRLKVHLRDAPAERKRRRGGESTETEGSSSAAS